jgi:hypothetical protein
MPYTNSQATPRSDIHALVMQANADFNKLFIGDQIFPVYGSEVKRGIYMTAQLADAQLLNADARARAAGAGYDRFDSKYDTDTFDCVEYGGEVVIDDSYESEVARFMNLEATEAMKLERRYHLAYEARIKTASFNSSTFTTTAAAVNYTAALLSTIDAPGDIDAAKQRLLLKGQIANAVWMSNPVFQRIRRSTLMQNQIYGVVPRGANQKALPGVADVAQALGVDNLYIGNAPYNSAAEGAAYSGSFIWNNTYIAVGVIQGGEFQAGGVGRTIQWTKDTTGLFTPETYRSDERRSNILRIRQHVAEKVIDTTACELITTSYS